MSSATRSIRHQNKSIHHPFGCIFFFFFNLRPLYLGGSVSDYAGDLPRVTNVVAGGGKKNFTAHLRSVGTESGMR